MINPGVEYTQLTGPRDASNDLVLGLNNGAERLPVTPSFRVREFSLSAKARTPHRDLIAKLQRLRDHYGKPLSISPASLGESHYTVFAKFDAHPHFEVSVRPYPAERDQVLPLHRAIEAAFLVTVGFETAGDPFVALAGNFDKAGISFGPIQSNLRSGTLQSLLRRFWAISQGACRACFSGHPNEMAELHAVLQMPKDRQLQWASGISAGKDGISVIEPWNTIFRRLGRIEAFREAMVEQALELFGRTVLRDIEWLQSHGIQCERAHEMAALYDCAIQQGGLAKLRREGVKPTSLLQALLARAAKASKRWVPDCVDRRTAILRRRARTPEIKWHFDARPRSNRFIYLLSERLVSLGTDADQREAVQKAAKLIAERRFQ